MAKKILVIDDDLDSLKLIGLLIQRQGYVVSAAPGGNEGLEKASKENPDLILLDIMMPGMNGLEVCRRLRSDPNLANIPVLMFTARTQADDKMAGFEAGADDYITKPTHPAELASRIKALLARTTGFRRNLDISQKAKVIAVAGVIGGSGVTTLAINLSMAIAGISQETILADLVYGGGSIGMLLGYPKADSLFQLCQQDLNQLSRKKIEGELVWREVIIRRTKPRR